MVQKLQKEKQQIQIDNHQNSDKIEALEKRIRCLRNNSNFLKVEIKKKEKEIEQNEQIASQESKQLSMRPGTAKYT